MTAQHPHRRSPKGGRGPACRIACAHAGDCRRHRPSRALHAFVPAVGADVVGAATVVVGLLGWFAVRRGLSPLKAIKRRADEITANRSIPASRSSRCPHELADLAATLNRMLSRLEESFQRLSNFRRTWRTSWDAGQQSADANPGDALQGGTAEDYRVVLESNAEEFRRLSRTISDMLFLAKADNGQIIPNRENIDLAEEIGNLLDFYNVLAEEKSIALSREGANPWRPADAAPCRRKPAVRTPSDIRRRRQVNVPDRKRRQRQDAGIGREHRQRHPSRTFAAPVRPLLSR